MDKQLEMEVRIRQEHKEDHGAVFELNRLAFKQIDEAGLVEQLRYGNAFIPELSLVAISDNKIVGHILFTKIKIVNDAKDESPSLALAPMAVLPRFQNKGIGGELIKYGLERARELHYGSVIVLGHHRYYPKFGFVPASKWNIRCPYDVPENVFMAMELVPGALRDVSGLVEYPKEFEGI